MLSGDMPFRGNNVREVMKRISLGRLDFDDEIWESISQEAKDLIK